MSIYSGFATRQQQQNYDQLVQDVIFVLQKRVIKFYQGESTNQNKFLDVLVDLHQQMSKMEQSKYLQPKSSRSIENLLRYLIIQAGHINYDDNIETNYKNQQIKYSSNTVPLVKSNGNVNRNMKSRLKHQMIQKDNSKQKQKSKEQNGSVGKIVRQHFQDDQSQCLTESRNTFINHDKIFSSNNIQNSNNAVINNFQNKNIEQNKNPQEEMNKTINTNTIKNESKQDFQLKKRFNNIYKPQAKIYKRSESNRETKRNETRQQLIEYLEKNNKNYHRGYRKRQVKAKNSNTIQLSYF